MSSVDRDLMVIGYFAAALMGLLVGVEVAGAAAAQFSGGHAFWLPWRHVVRTLMSLASTPDRRAWPLPYRRQLPDSMTVGFITGAIGALITAGVGFWVIAKYMAPKLPKSARWATRDDLGGLTVKSPQKGRLILGRHDGRLVAATDRQSTLVMGPTQQGKTAGVVIPGIMEWQGAVVSTSVKPDVYLRTRGRRELVGEVKVFDPLGRTNVPTATWSPIAEAKTWSRARQTAALLMQTGWEQEKADREPHWRKEAARFLAPLLLAAHHGDRTLADVLRWIHTDDGFGGDEGAGAIRTEPENDLRHSGDPHWREALDNLQATWNKDAKYWGSVYSTLDAGLDAWQEPSVVSATATADITAEWLLDGSNTLYIVAPERDQRRLANLVSALVMQLIDDAMVIASDRPDGRLDPPLLFALDEVANIAPIPNLAEIASTGLGPGILLLTVFQDYAQARERFGADRASSIMAQHTCKVFCAGISDPDTLDYVRRLTGDERVDHMSRTRNRQGQSETVAPHLQPLAPPFTLREGELESALLICGRIPPAWIRLRPYWRERTLKTADAAALTEVKA